ncbi:hypothetical protein ACSX1A_18860 [Pontibacter sp. MBLB2868]|uniref:hypothetical protein n=1 Tax=Pontibacter sp. MBLB2868 TaxID=3451555 RepID=UPI003F755B40
MLHPKLLYKLSGIMLCLLCIAAGQAHAQRPDKIKVKPTSGKLSADIRSEAYYYPDFQDGTVSFRNGRTTVGNLNYNMLTGEIEFINSKKDTLALANMYDVTQAIFGTDIFYYDPESENLLKLLEEYDDKKLFVNERYELTNIKNVGAFGMESSTTSPTSSSSNQNIGDTQNRLKQNESLIYSAKSSYFIADKTQYMPATRASILRMFPEHKSEIKKYIKNQKFNLNEKEDLSQLLKYIAEL